MNAIVLDAPRLDSIRRVSRPDPEPQAHEVLVRMRGASLNYVDAAVASGRYGAPSFPLVPIADGAGEIVTVGRGVDGWRPGDRVVVHAKPLWVAGVPTRERVSPMRGVSLPGSLAELVAVPASAVVRAPSHLDFVQAATLPIAATTAWNALRSASIGPGSTVLVLGTGGVAVFTVQLARLLGARVLVVSSSTERLARAAALGADVLVDRNAEPDWDAGVLARTDGRGVDLVLETGGASTLARSLAAAAHGGTVFSIGFLSGTRAELDVLPVIAKSLRVLGNNTGSVEDLAGAVRAIERHRLVPVVETLAPLEPATLRTAYERMLAGGTHFGKLAFEVALS